MSERRQRGTRAREDREVGEETEGEKRGRGTNDRGACVRLKDRGMNKWKAV